MIRFFANANYDFISLRRYAYAFTAAIIVPGLVLLAARGLNYSIEFTGGALVQVTAQQPVPIGDVRAALEQGGLRGAEITTFGTEREFVIRARLEAGAPEAADEQGAQRAAEQVTRALGTAFGEGAFVVERVEAVGPKVGGELRQKALGAILLSFVAVLVYLAYRFEWRFGLAAVLATAHDIVTTLAFVSYLNLEVSLVVVSAVLTVVGYSLNDTIIIFDRARENLHKYKRDDLAGILNRSINETLPRSVLTHGTTLAALLALLVFSSEVIRPFAWVMSFGVFTGTFSSIYIASPLLLWIERRWPGRDVRGVKAHVAPAGATPASGAGAGAPAKPSRVTTA
jgi:preprotein translocase subunit SecF